VGLCIENFLLRWPIPGSVLSDLVGAWWNLPKFDLHSKKSCTVNVCRHELFGVALSSSSSKAVKKLTSISYFDPLMVDAACPATADSCGARHRAPICKSNNNSLMCICVCTAVDRGLSDRCFSRRYITPGVQSSRVDGKFNLSHVVVGLTVRILLCSVQSTRSGPFATRLSVCLSVYLSHSCAVLKRLNGSCCPFM